MADGIQAALDAGVAAGHAPGFVAAAILPGGRRVTAVAGVRGADNPAPMTDDTVFWIASCTKALTSVAALQLVERGLVQLDAPVAPHLPALAAPRVLTGFAADGAPQLRPARTAITLRHLLTHTSGLAYDFCGADLARWLDATGATLLGGGDPDIPLLNEPGERWQYGIGIDWAGRLIEALSGQRLDAYIAEHVTGPLGMTETGFAPRDDQAGRRAGVHQRLEDRSLAPIPFGMPPPPHFMMGGGGLYSTAGDYLNFLAAILGGGAPVLGPQSIALLTSDQAAGLDAGVLTSARPATSHDFDPVPGVAKRHSLGFLVNAAPGPNGRSAGSLAWAGLANCYYWADPAAGVAGVMLAQVLPFADPDILATFAAFERAVYAP